jgi:peroxiredoxin
MLLRKLFPFLLCAASLTSGAEIPRPSPDFVVFMNDGRQIHIGEYKGKVVALAFILTACSHCQFTSQVLTKLQQEYGPRGFQVIASAINEMSKLYVPEFIKNFHPAYPVGYNEREAAEDYLQHPVMYRLLMPQVVVIDRKGTIRAQYAGDDKFFENAAQENNFRDLIEPLLKEGQAQTAGRKK